MPSSMSDLRTLIILGVILKFTIRYLGQALPPNHAQENGGGHSFS